MKMKTLKEEIHECRTNKWLIVALIGFFGWLTYMLFYSGILSIPSANASLNESMVANGFLDRESFGEVLFDVMVIIGTIFAFIAIIHLGTKILKHIIFSKKKNGNGEAQAS